MLNIKIFDKKVYIKMNYKDYNGTWYEQYLDAQCDDFYEPLERREIDYGNYNSPRTTNSFKIDNLYRRDFLILDVHKIVDRVLQNRRTDCNQKLTGTVENKRQIPYRSEKSKKKNSRNKDICIICMFNKRNVVFDCGHYSTCKKCANRINSENNSCPICRKKINRIIEVFE